MSRGRKGDFIQIGTQGHKDNSTKSSGKNGKEFQICPIRILIDLDAFRRQEQEEQEMKKQFETGRDTSAQTRREAGSHRHQQDRQTDEATPERSVRHVSPLITPSLIKAPKSSRKYSLQILQTPSRSSFATSTTKTDHFSLLETIIQQKQAIDQVLKRMFRRMTEDNHRFEQSHSSLNLNYTKLAITELSFLNVLFSRMDPLDLGAINYPTFKLRVLQTCPRELEALLEDQARRTPQ